MVEGLFILAQYPNSKSRLLSFDSFLSFLPDYFCEVCRTPSYLSFDPNRECCVNMRLLKELLESYSNLPLLPAASKITFTVTMLFYPSWKLVSLTSLVMLFPYFSLTLRTFVLLCPSTSQSLRISDTIKGNSPCTISLVFCKS